MREYAPEGQGAYVVALSRGFHRGDGTVDGIEKPGAVIRKPAFDTLVDQAVIGPDIVGEVI